METVIITGASGGIGYEFARLFAQKNNRLILVARNKEKLDKIADEFSAKYPQSVVLTYATDLSQIENIDALFKFTEGKFLDVDILINNAGFGEYGYFYDTNFVKEHQMINLNITALTYLTKLYLKQMLKRRKGKILNLASIAAFQPGPTMAVYFATKAYVLSFTEALAQELKEKGVRVMALCPGPTKTNFSSAANTQNVGFFKNANLPEAHKVAQFGIKMLMKNKTIAIHGIINNVLIFSLRFLPRKTIASIVKYMATK